MTEKLDRKISLIQATAINMNHMVGIGPFVVIPLVISYFHTSMFIWAWILGAFTALVDGMIWSELGAAYPLAGGSYNFLKVAYGKWGRLMSFLFVWQTSIQAPLVVASGAIGFSQYLKYLIPLTLLEQKVVSLSVILLITFLLYRKIEAIGKISVLLWICVLITIIWIIVGGVTHGNIHYSILPEKTGDFFKAAFWVALGQASVKTIYSYLGYYNVCHLGGEIKSPGKNIPASIFISVICIALLYLGMNLSIIHVIPWHQAAGYDFIVSVFIERIYGFTAAKIATALVLCVAFSSLFAALLGYSRVPYAAAADGNFFKIFARLHPEKNFPYVSLIFIASLAMLFSIFFSLREVISAILAMRILIQFIAQAIGVVILRRKKGTKHLPFKMWLYPFPVVISILIWLFIFYSTGKYAVWGLALSMAGIIFFYGLQRVNKKRELTLQK